MKKTVIEWLTDVNIDVTAEVPLPIATAMVDVAKRSLIRLQEDKDNEPIPGQMSVEDWTAEEILQREG